MIQREIEMLGIPTVLITVVPQESAVNHPPRAIHPVGFPIGNPLGKPHRTEVQRAVLLDALKQFEVLNMPGKILDRHIAP